MVTIIPLNGSFIARTWPLRFTLGPNSSRIRSWAPEYIPRAFQDCEADSSLRAGEGVRGPAIGELELEILVEEDDVVLISPATGDLS